MKTAVIYIHGKGGSAAESAHYEPLFPECDVIGFDYHAETPWEAKAEFPAYFAALREKYDAVYLIANSIGAYFSLHALAEQGIRAAFLISPIVDMEQLIGNMMQWAGVTEAELQQRGQIPTDFGEVLDWAYLSYVREHPITWRTPTFILYGGRDNMTSRETIAAFAERIHAALTIMPEGEHWFHTEEQMQFLDQWIRDAEGGIA